MVSREFWCRIHNKDDETCACPLTHEHERDAAYAALSAVWTLQPDDLTAGIRFNPENDLLTDVAEGVMARVWETIALHIDPYYFTHPRA